MRYNSIGTKRNVKGKRSMVTSLMPRIKKRSSDTFVVMVEKTRLDHLAHKFYGNPNYWWIIAAANNIYGTMFPELGVQLRIPREIGEILSEYEGVNS